MANPTSTPQLSTSSPAAGDPADKKLSRTRIREEVPESSRLDHSSPNITSFADLVLIRHSIRFFLPDPVSPTLLRECLAVAQHAPSNSNIQPWRLFLATGAAHTRLSTALAAAAADGPPQIPPLPAQYKHFRSDLGKQLYGAEGYGIPREDKERHLAAERRNYEFFGAPASGIVCMDKVLDPWDAMSVGMWLQTLLLAFTERGLGTCLEVSVIGYPEVLRKELDIPDHMLLLCGLAIGWPVEDHKVNRLVTDRESFNAPLVWREE